MDDWTEFISLRLLADYLHELFLRSVRRAPRRIALRTMRSYLAFTPDGYPDHVVACSRAFYRSLSKNGNRGWSLDSADN